MFMLSLLPLDGVVGGGVVAPVARSWNYEIPAGVIGAHIEQALAEAATQGVAGAAVTPFLLARVAELTGGASLAANIELVLSNARLAGEIACAYAGLAAASD